MEHTPPKSLNFTVGVTPPIPIRVAAFVWGKLHDTINNAPRATMANPIKGFDALTPEERTIYIHLTKRLMRDSAILEIDEREKK